MTTLFRAPPTQIIAHRGASRAERENTLAAFRRAGEMGADAVELDVRTTADGALIVHHDAVIAPGELDGASGIGRPLVDLARSLVPAHVPTLGDALDACAGMWVNVEIKNDPSEPDFDPTDHIADAVVHLLRQRDEPERWLISSFRIETLDRCRLLAPEIATAWLTVAVPDDVVEVLHDRGHGALHPWYGSVDEDLVRRCHDAGIRVNVWTCDEADAMRRLAGWGVDGICTNVPDVAIDVLSR